MKELSVQPRCRFILLPHHDNNSEAPQKGGASWN